MSRPAPAGYSGTPLPNKLGIVAGTRGAVLHAPDDVAATLGELPAGAESASRLARGSGLRFAPRRELR